MKLNWQLPLLGATLLSGLFLFSSTLTATPTGEGTEENPYLISTEDELNQFRIAVNGGNSFEGIYFKLNNDLDFKDFDDDGDSSNGNFTPIGTSATPFKGYFDGGQHTISNVTIKRGENYLGFFGYKTEGWIKQLILDNINVQCTASNSFTIGGLAGFAFNTTIEEVGILNSKVLFPNTNSGYSGGLVSRTKKVTIKNSYVQAHVRGEYVGGFVYFAEQSTIENSYFVGKIEGYQTTQSTRWKGFINSNVSSTLTNCYWDSSITQDTTVVTGGRPLTTDQFKTYTQTQTLPGFDFEKVWTSNEDEESPYPIFKIKPRPVGSESSDMTVTGNIQPLVLSIDVPTSEATFVLNPNGLTEQQFVAPSFTFTNQSNSPLTMELKEFVQTTDVVTDVLSDHFPSWDGLNKTESKHLALALTPIEGNGWEEILKTEHYVAENTKAMIGVIQPHQGVELTFKAFHGTAFNEALLPSYRLTFIFGLKD